MDSISFSGGLGNQLFQWAAAHSRTATSKFKIDLHLYSNSSTRNFELKELVQCCSHVKYKKNNLKNYSMSRLLESLDSHGIAISVLGTLGLVNDKNYRKFLISKDRLRSKFYLSGLFQDAYLVEQVYAEIKSEIDFVLMNSMKSLTNRILIPDHYLLLHVRRSDYPISHGPSNFIGQLSDRYFIELAEDSKLPIILLSEHEADITDLRDAIKPHLVLSSSQTNSWEVLALMSNAEVFIGSNSTLSWWGAFLATKKGAAAWLPSEWSQWSNIDSRNFFLNSIRYASSSWKIE